MTKETRNHNHELDAEVRPRCRFDIRHWELFRHSSFGFRHLFRSAATAIVFLIASGITVAQQGGPHLAYVYPAGGKAGSTFQIIVGGQFLMTASNAFVTGPGVTVTVLDHQRPMGQKEFN